MTEDEFRFTEDEFRLVVVNILTRINDAIDGLLELTKEIHDNNKRAAAAIEDQNRSDRIGLGLPPQ